MINVIVFIFKGWFLVFVMMWIRWTLPRLRIDQVMMTCLKYLVPISCVLLAGVSVWQVALPHAAHFWVRLAIFAASLAGVLLLIWQWYSWMSAPPSTAMPGMWRNTGVIGYQGARKP